MIWYQQYYIYIDHKGLGFLALNPMQKQENIYFLTAGQYWLGTAKSKNVFR